MRSLNKFFLLMIFAFVLIVLSLICFSAAILTEVFTISCSICSLKSITLMMREWELFVKFWDSFMTVQKETLNEFWFIKFFIVFMIKERIIEFDRVMTDVTSSSFENSWNDDSSFKIISLSAAVMWLNALMICLLMMRSVMTFMQADKICRTKNHLMKSEIRFISESTKCYKMMNVNIVIKM